MGTEPTDGGPVHLPLLSVRGVSKSYGAVKALRDVSIEFFPGEVHAIVGENGAGKTTLERLIAGEEGCDEGEIRLGSSQTGFRSPEEAYAAGITVVHQSFPLVSGLTVAQNMFLRNPPLALSIAGRGVLNRRRMSTLAAEALRPFGLEKKADFEVRNLGVAERQLVEIARATLGKAKVMIFDEPTSSLSKVEVAVLFQHMERIRAEGAAVIFISHRIDEIQQVADHLTVLRDGKVVHTGTTREVDAERIVSLIAGRHVVKSRQRTSRVGEETLLEARLRSGTEYGVELEVKDGEIVGVAGLLNSGAQEVLARVSGEQSFSADQIKLRGQLVSANTIAGRIDAGICLLPGDHERSLALHLSITDNVALPNQSRFRRGPFTDSGALGRVVRGLVDSLGIRPTDPSRLVHALSGGNKQKVAMAKWLASDAQVIVMDDPYRGVDVGAKDEMGEVIRQYVEAGGGVLIYSSDVRDLTGLCDRILVMRDGNVVANFDSTQFDEAGIMSAAVGATAV